METSNKIEDSPASVASESGDIFGTLNLQDPAPRSASASNVTNLFKRRQSYDVESDPHAQKLTGINMNTRSILPGMEYGLDPFTGNVLDNNEDLLVPPSVVSLLQNEKAEDERTNPKVVIDVTRPEDSHADLLRGSLNNQVTRLALSWANVSYKIQTDKKKRKMKLRKTDEEVDVKDERIILDGIHGQARPGETVAIIGSSGAGKTTLLNILAGRVTEGEIGGKILVNGAKRTRIWKKLVAYVEQDDIMVRNLTVRETLTDVALLRLPRTLTTRQKVEQAEKIMETLGITGCADTQIGDPSTQGISGGERKRTAIAMQLITKPRLLFLDEPTSGLDAYTAISIIETITQLAQKEANTVLMTIHQPREDILFLFDKVLLLSQGRTVFFGPVQAALDYFQSVGFECPRYVNPADFFMDTISLDLTDDETQNVSQQRIDFLKRSWLQVEARELERRRHVKRPSLIDMAELAYANAALHEGDKDVTKKNRQSLWYNDKRNFWHVELFILLRRCFKDFSREMVVSLGLAIQTLVLFLVMSFTFFQLPLTQPGIQGRVGVLFMIIGNLTFATILPLLHLFSLEKRVIISDRFSTTYRMSSYYTAKAISVFPFRLLLALFFVMAAYYIVGLNPLASRYFTAALITLDIIFTSQALGLFLGAIAPNVEVAQVVGPLLITLFYIYGGNLANLTLVPPVLRWIQWISIVRYGYLSFFQNEFAGLTFECYNGQPPVNNQCTPGFATGDQVIMFYDQNVLSITVALLILFSFGLCFHVATYITLRIVTKPKMKLV